MLFTKLSMSTFTRYTAPTDSFNITKSSHYPKLLVRFRKHLLFSHMSLNLVVEPNNKVCNMVFARQYDGRCIQFIEMKTSFRIIPSSSVGFKVAIRLYILIDLPFLMFSSSSVKEQHCTCFRITSVASLISLRDSSPSAHEMGCFKYCCLQ